MRIIKYHIIVFCLLFSNCDSSKEKKTEIKEIAKDTISLDSIMKSGPFINNLKEGGLTKTGIFSIEYDIHPYDSIRLGYYNGSLVNLSKIKNGKSNGICLEFNEDGSLYMIGNMKNDKSNGIFLGFSQLTGIRDIHLLHNGKTYKKWRVVEVKDSLAHFKLHYSIPDTTN